MKNYKIILPLLVILLIIGFGLNWYTQKNNHNKDASISETINEKSCIIQRTGTVSMKMLYPDRFKLSEVLAEDGYVEFRKPDGTGLILSIDWYPGYLPVESLLNTGQVEPGPIYEASSFNGHDAAFFQSSSNEEGVWEYYKVPFGNRVMEIGYHPSVLTSEEKELAETMLESITLSELNEEIERSKVINCNEKE